MKYTKAIAVLGGFCFGLCCLSGCVRPGAVQSDVLAEYHRALADRGPQRRGPAGTLEAYQPLDGPGPKLTVRDAKVYVTLTESIQRALANNPHIRVVSYEPELAYEDIVRAAAAFDVTVFGLARLDNGDQAPPPNNPFAPSQSETRSFQVGANQRLITGATWQTTLGLTRSWSDFGSSPRTTWAPSVDFEITQPLGRGAGTNFNLAELRIARLSYQLSEAEFRQNVEQLVFDVHQAYFRLIQAIINRDIQQQLLEITKQTYERIKKRGVHDATKVEIRQAEAAVATRQAALVRTRKTVQDARDTLARLMSDPQANVITELRGVPIVPTTPLVDEQIVPNPTDQLLLALENSPLLDQARKGIALAAVGIDVAENQVLPKVDLTASVNWNERAFQAGNAIDRMGNFDFYGAAIQLAVEYPLGNRLREAELRQARYEHLQAIASYQDAVDAVALRIMERIRAIDINWQEMLAQIQAVEAAKAQLEALNARERLLGRLSPEFLNVKLQAQQTLATARQGLLAAQVQYNTALIELAQVTGTLLDESQVLIGPPDQPIRQIIQNMLAEQAPPIPAEPVDQIPDRQRFLQPETDAPAAETERPVPPPEPLDPAGPDGL